MNIGEPDECWEWQAAANGPYGAFKWSNRAFNAHRWSYVLAHGCADPELVIDHLCRNTMCVNPAHLEAVTHEENVRRGIARAAKITECTRGHLYDEANTGWYEHPVSHERERFCRACKREKRAESRQDPAVRQQQRDYMREYKKRPEARAAQRERAARDRASWSPEKRQAQIEYLREYRRRKKAEAAG